MSGESETRPSGWTVDTLREHVLAMMDERDRRYAERFAAQEKAVNVALEQTKTRFENVNEWRGTVTDLLNNAMPRPEAENRSVVNNEKIGQLSSRVDRIEARSGGQSSMWTYVLGAIGVVLTLLSIGNLILNIAGVPPK